MPLHSHTTFSMMDGLGSCEEHAEVAKEVGLKGMACSDHASTSSWYRWEAACKSVGINPVFGVESYWVEDRTQKDRSNCHLLFLAKSTEGLKTINRLCTDAVLSGFYYKPRTDWELLEKHNQDIVCTTSCVAGPLGHYLLKEKNPDKARDWLLRAQRIFGEDIYLELQPHPFGEQLELNKFLCSLGDNFKLIAANDSHYPRPEDKDDHDMSVCVATKARRSDENRLRYEYDFSVKSLEQLYEELQKYGGVSDNDAAEAVDNAKYLSENLRVELSKGLPLTPSYDDPARQLEKLTVEGWNKRVKPTIPADMCAEYKQRISREIKLFKDKGFAEYFLVVAEMVQAAKERGVYVGPGRGSAAGSLVCYCLGITEVDSIFWDLSLERFMAPHRGGLIMDMDVNAEEITSLENMWRERTQLNSDGLNDAQRLRRRCERSTLFSEEFRERLELELKHIGWQELEAFYLGADAELDGKDKTYATDRHYVAYLLRLSDTFDPDKNLPLSGDLPDIDIDFSNREKVYDYLVERWGAEYVANVANYSTLGVKDAIARTARVLSTFVDKAIVDHIDTNHEHIDEFLATENATKLPQRVQETLRYAARLQGNVHHLGRTAAGVIVSSVPVTEYTALARTTNQRIVAAYDKRDAEKIGFVKMDVLGLSALEIIESTREVARERGEDPPDPWKLPLDDPNVLDVFRRVETDLVFQFAQSPMKNLMKKLAPENFGDLVAANALVRTGADDKTYISRKLGQENLNQVRNAMHPDVAEVLQDTYYVLVYQEQAMRLCREVAEMSHRDVNRVRKLAAKKENTDELAELGRVFVAGAIRHGLSETEATGVWGTIRRTSLYNFNKSHAVAYSLISWACAYYQTYHPLAWAVGNLRVKGSEQWHADKSKEHARRNNIRVADPDINRSGMNWSYEGLTLYQGLTTIAGVGPKLARSIVAERDANGPFADMDEAMVRLKGKGFGKGTRAKLEAAGAAPEVEGDPMLRAGKRGDYVKCTLGHKIHPLYKVRDYHKVGRDECSWVHLYVTHVKKEDQGYRILFQSGARSGKCYTPDKIGVGPYVGMYNNTPFLRCYVPTAPDELELHPMEQSPPGPNLQLPPKGKPKRGTWGWVYAYPTKQHTTNSDKTILATPILCPEPRVVTVDKPIEEEGYYILGLQQIRGDRPEDWIFRWEPYYSAMEKFRTMRKKGM